MNGTDMKFWLDLAQWLVTIGLAVSVWLRKPGEDAGAAVKALKESVDEELSTVNTRLATLDERVRHMPTSDELAELEGTVKAVSAQIDGLREGVKTMRIQLNRIEEYIMNAKAAR